MNIADIYWHYTTGANFIRIVEDGFIVPATANISPKERPVVWFSSKTFWEPTAAKGLMQRDGSIKTLDMIGTYQHGRGLVRFGVSATTASLTWTDFLCFSGIERKVADNLRRIGEEAGSGPTFWRACGQPVAVDECAQIDVFDGAAWVTVRTNG